MVDGARPMSTTPMHPRLGRVAVSLWIAGTIFGVVLLWDYSATQGMVARPDRSWPDSPGLLRPEDKPCVVMFAHPRCPCTRASLEELDRLMRDCRAVATVVFWQPEFGAAEWRDSDLVRVVRQSPRLHVHLDNGGDVTKTFGVMTSGTCLVFDSAGSLRFNGGLTPGRGHRGTTAAHARIAAILKADRATARSTSGESFPVFGCSIRR